MTDKLLPLRRAEFSLEGEECCTFADAYAAMATMQKRITELQAQLASGQEPVAWMVFWGLGKKRPGALFIDRENAVRHAKQIKSETEVRPVYTHPAPSQRPLSDEQIFDFGPGQPDAVWSYEDQLYFARAIEAKHGIKGKP